MTSGAALVWTGGLIDRVSLPRYTLLAGLLLIIACLFISLAAGPISLLIAIFLLRQSGQGLTTHLSFTTMARYFGADRGRAIAVATIGFATGEALLPFLAVISISLVGWRWTYCLAAALLACILLPVSLWLLKGFHQRYHESLNQATDLILDSPRCVRSWSRSEVLNDARFYMLLPGFVAPSIISTAMFFHHLTLADSKDWSYAWITGNYVVYGASVVFTVLITGPLIDRFRTVRLLPYMLIPLVLALLIVSLFSSSWVVALYMLLFGCSAGMAHALTTAMWPELYGVKHLGSIKSLAFAITVFGSALGPVILGGLMDLGVSIESVCLLFAGYSIVGGALIYVALRKS